MFTKLSTQRIGMTDPLQNFEKTGDYTFKSMQEIASGKELIFYNLLHLLHQTLTNFWSKVPRITFIVEIFAGTNLAKIQTQN